MLSSSDVIKTVNTRYVRATFLTIRKSNAVCTQKRPSCGIQLYFNDVSTGFIGDRPIHTYAFDIYTMTRSIGIIPLNARLSWVTVGYNIIKIC